MLQVLASIKKKKNWQHRKYLRNAWRNNLHGFQSKVRSKLSSAIVSKPADNAKKVRKTSNVQKKKKKQEKVRLNRITENHLHVSKDSQTVSSNRLVESIKAPEENCFEINVKENCSLTTDESKSEESAQADIMTCPNLTNQSPNASIHVTGKFNKLR